MKRLYGLRERQLKRCFRLSKSRAHGDVGYYLLQLLERRLDNVVYRLGFSLSRAQARQMITHGHITVNGKRVLSPSYETDVGDIVRPKKAESSIKIVSEALKSTSKYEVPSWLKVKQDALEGEVTQIPSLDELVVPLDKRLIVEFLSR